MIRSIVKIINIAIISTLLCLVSFSLPVSADVIGKTDAEVRSIAEPFWIIS